MKKINNYYDAVHYLDNALILCNDITKIDPDFYADDYLGPWLPEDEDDAPEIYQYFLTNYSFSDAQYLAERFGLLFQYSPLLDLWVLCVPHFGTMWKGVNVEDNYEKMQ
jgi:hypothetical protein